MSNLTTKDFSKVAEMMAERGLTQKQVAKEVSFALQIINKSSQLQEATMESKQSAVLNVAQCGLTLNPVMKLAYLVPRWSREGTICYLEPSYQGLVKLLTDAGSVETIQCQLVYAQDTFQFNAGDFNNPITHTSNPFSKNRGDLVGVYALAVLPSGIKQAETMSIEEVYEIRDKSESWKAYQAKKIKSCVWSEHEGEMVRKTVLRRIVKYLPKTEKFNSVAKAIHLDETDYKPSANQIDYAYNLLENSTVVERMEMANYELRIENATSDELSDIITELQDRQRDNGIMGMKEINKKVQQIAKS
jgi:phage RecT family recombinase